MKLDRLLGILTLLLQNDGMTAPRLAERFEVSRRTIGRDIDALCRAGIPIVTRQGGGGGVSIAEGYRLDKSVLTPDELSGILAALRGLGSVSERSVIERTLEKLSPGRDMEALREPIVINLASWYGGSLTPKLRLLKQAVLGHRVVEFDYHYEKGLDRRRIEPHLILFQWSDWYVLGYCLSRRDWRLFKLGRLWEPRLCDESFVPREIPPEQRDPSARLPDDKRLAALFDPSVRYRLIEAYGPDCYTEEADGRLRLEVGYSNEEHMLGWLLGFGDRVTVLEPAEVAERMRGIAEKMLENYK